MRRVISSLLIMSAIPKDCYTNEHSILDESIRRKAYDALIGIINDANLKSFFVSELRVATKGPRWMQCAARELFTQVLLGEHGLEYVLRAYLDGELFIYLNIS
jgi:hypothetical protein